MENKADKNKPKVAVSEDYDSKKPQNQNLPKYNSTTEHRDGSELPAVENLNQEDGLKDKPKSSKNEHPDIKMTETDASLYGKNTKTDLGAGQRDQDEDEDEKIIRT